MRKRNRCTPQLWMLVGCLLWGIGLGASAADEGQLTRTLEASLDYSDVSLVALDIPVGTLQVRGWDQWRVQLQSRGEVFPPLSPRVSKYLDQVTIRHGFANETARFELILPEEPPGEIRWRHTLFLPAEAIVAVKIRQAKGALQILGLQGEWQIEMGEGQVELREVTGKFQITLKQGQIQGGILFTGASAFQVQRGAIDLKVLDSLPQPMRLTLDQGDLTLTLPEDYPGKVDAETQRGTVRCTLSLADVVQKTPQRLEATLAYEGPPLVIRVGQGDVNLRSFTEERAQEIPEVPPEWPTVAVPPATETPQIDGWLNDRAWRRTAKVTDLRSLETLQSAEVSTEVYLTHDAEQVYLAARLHEPTMERLYVSAIEPGQSIAQDDGIAWWFEPTPGNFYAIRVNPPGIVETDHLTSSPDDTEVTVAPWDPPLTVKTRLGPTGWLVEAALPWSALELESPPETWEWNVYRFRPSTGEISGWLPAPLDEMSSGHLLPQVLGPMRFAAPSAEIPSWNLEAVRVQGAQAFPESAVQTYLQLEPETPISPLELPEMEAALRDLGIYEQVTVQFEPTASGVILTLELQETETLDVQAVRWAGNVYFPTSLLQERFPWDRGLPTTEQFWNIRCRILETLYHAHGYALASVDWERQDGELTLRVEEGRLARIQVEGAQHIPPSEIRARLEPLLERPYREDEAQKQKESLLQYLESQPRFESLESWQVIQQDGEWVLQVSIREVSGFEHRVRPRVDCNRVQGLVLGVRFESAGRFPVSARGFGELSYGVSSEQGNFLFGLEKRWFRRHPLRVGAMAYLITDTPDWERIDPLEASLRALLGLESFRDYYQREGWAAWIRQQITPSTALEGRWTAEEHAHLYKTTNWSLVRSDWPKRSNRRIHPGVLHALQIDLTFDSRETKAFLEWHGRKHPVPGETRRGWLGVLRYEKAGGTLEGDFEYQRFEATVVRYEPVTPTLTLVWRVRGGVADHRLPPQKQFVVGGAGTLRGYPFKTWLGDNLALVNLEGRWRVARWGGLLAFADAGGAWPHGERPKLRNARASLGIGIFLRRFRVELAQPLERKRTPQVSLHLRGMF